MKYKSEKGVKNISAQNVWNNKKYFISGHHTTKEHFICILLTRNGHKQKLKRCKEKVLREFWKSKCQHDNDREQKVIEKVKSTKKNKKTN